jgi:hypothetical protein
MAGQAEQVKDALIGTGDHRYTPVTHRDRGYRTDVVIPDRGDFLAGGREIARGAWKWLVLPLERPRADVVCAVPSAEASG